MTKRPFLFFWINDKPFRRIIPLFLPRFLLCAIYKLFLFMALSFLRRDASLSGLQFFFSSNILIWIFSLTSLYRLCSTMSFLYIIGLSRRDITIIHSYTSAYIFFMLFILFTSSLRIHYWNINTIVARATICFSDTKNSVPLPLYHDYHHGENTDWMNEPRNLETRNFILEESLSEISPSLLRSLFATCKRIWQRLWKERKHLSDIHYVYITCASEWPKLVRETRAKVLNVLSNEV
jgi:hypothetical protein